MRKKDKYKCKWIRPSENAPWEWQDCFNPNYRKEYRDFKRESSSFTDISCGFEKGCDCFELAD